MNTSKAANVDEYIAGFPAEVQKAMEQIRAAIKAAAPEAEEAISYAMPAYAYQGPLVYFGAFKNHIGFYATPTGNEAFREELSAYKMGRGSIQFPLDKPMPLDLIARMVKYRMQENTEKAKKKKGKGGD